MKYVIGFVIAIFLLVLIGAVTISTGAYNFAASEAHAGSVRSLIDTALRQSVAQRAEDLNAPPVTPEDLRHGFSEFAEYCAHCHGSPAGEAHEWTRGMRPQPPELSRVADRWSTEEIFWIAKHGIKFTGMPAFGHSESDETLWHIAAFVKQLPQMSAEEYDRMRQTAGGGEGHDHGEHEH